MSSEGSPHRYFDVNDMSLPQLDTGELRHARWLYRKELRRAWWLGVGLSLAWWVVGAFVLGLSLLLFWAALEGTRLVVEAGLIWAAEWPVAPWPVARWLIFEGGARGLGIAGGIAATLLGLVAVRRVVNGSGFDSWLRRLESSKDEVWAIVRTRRGTLRQIRRLLAARH